MNQHPPTADQRACDKTLVYLSYGSGPHVQDTLFSLLTAYSFLPPGSASTRYVLYTDDPTPFAGFDLTLRCFDAEEFTRWLGGTDYLHRVKTCVLQDALLRFPGAVLFVDSDTYFRKSPTHVFRRVSLGRAVFHVLENRIGRTGEAAHKGLMELTSSGTYSDAKGKVVPLTPASLMWNTGVIGMHSADAGLLRDALVLTDQLWAGSRCRVTEQVAMSLALRNFQLSEAMAEVFHYWPGHLRPRFRERIADVLRASSGEALAARARYCYQHRPIPPAALRFKAGLKHLLVRAGLPVSGVVRSA